MYIYIYTHTYGYKLKAVGSTSADWCGLARGSRLYTSGVYVGNLGFGIHCHPLDSVNPGFIRRAPLVNPLDSFGFTYRDS